MMTFLGYPPEKILKEIEKKQKTTLTVNLVWNSSHTHPDLELKVNNISREFNTPIEVEKNSNVDLYVYTHLEGRTHFTRFSFEPIETNHDIAEYSTSYNVSSSQTIDAIFTELPPV